MTVTAIAIALAFAVCYFALSFLESDGKILNRIERVQNNFLWDA
jgi:hypothetical protein